VSDPALSAAFFDPARRLFGSLRGGLGVLFDGNDHRVLPDPPELAGEAESWVARLGEGSELRFDALSPPLELAGTTTRICRVGGRLDGRRVDCLGATTETLEVPQWEELDAVRALVALFGESDAVLASARRPRGAPGHGREAISAILIEHGEVLAVEDARLSTVYDGDGRQRSAGLELWLSADDFPRRLTGVARAGMSLGLEGLDVHLAVFDWRLEGREGAGSYEVTVRSGEEAAA
jgi:hypothetical protein